MSEEQQLLASGYVLGQLDAEESAIFAQQLAANPALREEVYRLQQALEAGFAPPEVSPPPHLRAAILGQAPPTTAPPPLPARVQPTTPLPRWAKGLGAIAAVTIAGLSLSNIWLWRSLHELRLASTGQPTLQLDLEPTAATLAADATVLVDPNSLQATLKVENLPSLPPGQVYVLWTVLEENAAYTTDDKNAILTQVFRVDSQGQVVEQFVLPQAFHNQAVVKAVAITVEDAAAPQRHESSPILIEQL